MKIHTISDRETCNLRSGFAVIMASGGHSAADIAHVLSLKTKSGHAHKERARAYAAKGRRQISGLKFKWEGGL